MYGHTALGAVFDFACTRRKYVGQLLGHVRVVDSPDNRLVIGGPVNTVKSVSTAGGTDLPAEFEARAASDTLVGKRLLAVRPCERSPDAGESTHCEVPQELLLMRSSLVAA